jgi:hypothetical protein
MIQIQIDNTIRNLDDINKNWIIEQITNRRKKGTRFCLKVIIEMENINIALPTSDCPKSNGTREATSKEKIVFELWDNLNLNQPDYNPRDLITFLNKIC